MADPFVLRLLFESVDEGTGRRLIQSQFITADDVPRIVDLGGATVVDLTGPGEASDEDRQAAADALAAHGISRVHVPVTNPRALYDACDAVEEALDSAFPTGAAALVHCHGGTDRSVCAATAVVASDRGVPFRDQLSQMFLEYPEISPSRSMAAAAARWVDHARDRVYGVPWSHVRCPACAERGTDAGLWGGLCETDGCEHTACPHCRDGRGTGTDGCPHLVLEARAGQVLNTAFRRQGAMPYFEGQHDDLAWVQRAITPWLATPEDPWPDGPTRPPDAVVLQMIACALSGAEVRVAAVDNWDFAEDGSPIVEAMIRVYASDPARTARRAEDQLDRLAFVMDHFGPVETGITS